ncbi:hypothetical protein ABPG73_020134 [Tetrahymena malaccensis]
MVLDSKTGICKCRYQFYRVGEQCFQCKNYCQGCIDADNCIQKDPNRMQNGVCSNNYFDDGYSCLQVLFNIDTLQNFIRLLFAPLTAGSCNFLADSSVYVTQPELKIIKLVGQLFAFKFKVLTPEQYSSLAYLADSSGNELFTVMFKTQTINTVGAWGISTINLYSVVFLANGSTLQEVQINQRDFTWIGIFTTFEYVYFFIYTNGQQLQTQSYDLTSLFSSIDFRQNFMLCVGKYNRQMQNLIATQTIVAFSFTVDFENMQFSAQLQDLQTNAILTIQANQNSAFFDRFKGILFSPQNSGYISSLYLQNSIPTLSVSIFIEQLTYQVQILKLVSGTVLQVEYYIVPYGTRAFIRICYYDLQSQSNSVCRDSSYSMLFLNQYNTLQIIYRNRSPYFSDIFIQEFEIICNYQIEIITFTNMSFFSIQTDTVFLFQQTADQNFGNFLIYLNSIEIHVGDGSYYEDRSSFKKCFLFKDVYDMKCIILKRGFLNYKNQIITQEACLSYSLTLGTLHVINYSAQQCIDTQLTNLCIEIQSETQIIKCKTCKYQYADPNNNCQCPPGMFFNSKKLTCQKCNSYCLTCKTSSDNCTSCLQPDQAPPRCNCISKNMFLDKNHVCQQCSYKCISCEFQSDLCTQCEYNRDKPPFCNCNSQYQEISQMCQPLICDQKCNSCQYASSNCVTCKQGRIQPPDCSCDKNYVENKLDGTCIPCPQGQFYDSKQQSCLACISPCKSCTLYSNQCTECFEGFILEKYACKCQNGYSISQIQNQKYKCLKNMGVSLRVFYSQSFYYLEFKFDLNIENIKIPSNLYFINNPLVSGNTLSVRLNIMQSFQTLSGKVKFFDTTQIIDVSKNFILDQIYQENPLSFSIGPFLFDESTLGSGFINNFLDKLEYQNGDVQYPPNLYKFYKIIGKLIFPEIVDYQLQNYKQQFQLFYMDLNTSEVYSANNQIYKRLGLSNSFIVNTQGVINKYLFIFLLILIIQSLVDIFYIKISALRISNLRMRCKWNYYVTISYSNTHKQALLKQNQQDYQNTR